MPIEATGSGSNQTIEDQPFGAALLVRDPDGIALAFYHRALAAV